MSLIRRNVKLRRSSSGSDSESSSSSESPIDFGDLSFGSTWESYSTSNSESSIDYVTSYRDTRARAGGNAAWSSRQPNTKAVPVPKLQSNNVEPEVDPTRPPEIIVSISVSIPINETGGQHVATFIVDPFKETLANFKRKILEYCEANELGHLNAKVTHQQIYYAGNQLKDDRKTLADYYIQKETTLNIFISKTANPPFIPDNEAWTSASATIQNNNSTINNNNNSNNNNNNGEIRLPLSNSRGRRRRPLTKEEALARRKEEKKLEKKLHKEAKEKVKEESNLEKERKKDEKNHGGRNFIKNKSAKLMKKSEQQQGDNEKSPKPSRPTTKPPTYVDKEEENRLIQVLSKEILKCHNNDSKYIEDIKKCIIIRGIPKIEAESGNLSPYMIEIRKLFEEIIGGIYSIQFYYTHSLDLHMIIQFNEYFGYYGVTIDNFTVINGNNIGLYPSKICIRQLTGIKHKLLHDSLVHTAPTTTTANNNIDNKDNSDSSRIPVDFLEQKMRFKDNEIENLEAQIANLLLSIVHLEDMAQTNIIPFESNQDFIDNITKFNNVEIPKLKSQQTKEEAQLERRESKKSSEGKERKNSKIRHSNANLDRESAGEEDQQKERKHHSSSSSIQDSVLSKENSTSSLNKEKKRGIRHSHANLEQKSSQDSGIDSPQTKEKRVKEKTVVSGDEGKEKKQKKRISKSNDSSNIINVNNSGNLSSSSVIITNSTDNNIPNSNTNPLNNTNPPPSTINKDMPPPWQAYVNEKGVTYYYNPETKISQWEHPLIVQAREKKLELERYENLNLLPPWRAYINDQGKTYYFNSVTQTSQWDRPV